MKNKKTKVLTIILIVLAVMGITAYNNYKSKHESVIIDERFLYNNWSSVSDGDFVEEVLYVKKFTDEESVAFALTKNSKDIPCVFLLWDGISRYDYGNILEITPDDFSDVNSYKLTDNTEFGQPYFCLFENPTSDTVEIEGKEHKVFKFECTINNVPYNLGFYCGLFEDKSE